MLHTVETRWFFAAPPLARTELFHDGIQPSRRTDWYAFPCDRRCGIKTREGKLESKLLVKGRGTLCIEDVVGHMEEWAKWSVELPPDDLPPDWILRSTGWVAVEKVRYVRSFSVAEQSVVEVDRRAENGCEFEWTELSVRGQKWWTIGFEALGCEDQLESNMHMVARAALHSMTASVLFRESDSYGYPEWLNRLSDHGQLST